jgi:hypothetical protein
MIVRSPTRYAWITAKPEIATWLLPDGDYSVVSLVSSEKSVG